MTKLQEIQSWIEGSLPGIRSKDVKVIKELNTEEMAYKLAFATQTDKTLPLTNSAVDLGAYALVSIDRNELTKKKRNLQSFKVGYHLLNILFEQGILSLSKGRKKTDKYMVKQVKEDWLEELHAELDSFENEELSFRTRPSFVKPEPFKSFHHETAGNMIVNADKRVGKMANITRCPKTFEVINTQMQIPYRINVDLLDVYMKCQEDNIFTLKHKKLTDEQEEGMLREIKHILSIANGIGDRTFYEYNYYDWRGRLYSTSVWLNHAGSKLAKSLFIMDRQKPMGSDGLFWLHVHTSNCFGYDKDTIDGRYEFAVNNMDEWMKWAADPVTNKGWQEVDAPFEFLAAIMELHKAFQSGDPTSYESGILCAWDATCSGLQVLSALARDQKSAELCNLTTSDKRGDYYLAIADNVWSKISYTKDDIRTYEDVTHELAEINSAILHASTKEEKDMAFQDRRDFFAARKEDIQTSAKVFWGRPEVAKLKRKICKTPCMTYFYSCGVRTMSKAMYTTHSVDAEFAGLTPSYCFWLCRRIFEACQEEMPVATQLMDMFIKLGVKEYHEGNSLVIDAPITNFPFVQTYTQDVTQRVEVRYKGKPIKPCVAVEPNGKMDFQKIKSATSPNIVHMYDAQIVAAIVLGTNYDVTCIHDSFSTIPANAGKLFEDTRIAFHKLFTPDQLLALLKEQGAEEYLEDVTLGNLDINEMLDNDFNFL